MKRNPSTAKRPEAMRLEDRLRINEWIHQGLTQNEIAGLLNKDRPAELRVTQQSISNDVKKIRAAAADRLARSRADWIAEHLQKLHALETAAWEGWHKSQGTDARFLGIVLPTLERAALLLGLDAGKVSARVGIEGLLELPRKELEGELRRLEELVAGKNEEAR